MIIDVDDKVSFLVKKYDKFQFLTHGQISAFQNVIFDA